MPSFLKLKPSVRVSPQCIIAVAFINAANELGLTGLRYITSGNDGLHMRGSKHYSDEALDFRSKDLKTVTKHALKAAVQARLGGAYQVLLEDEGGENEHFHIEHDPRA